MKTPTTKRRAQLEKLIRRCRADARIFGEDNAADKLGRILRHAKARLLPTYESESRARRNAEFERQYSIDTAINCRGL